MRYVIGSGWWSADEHSDGRAVRHGSARNRSSEFHAIWYRAICEFTKPEKIIIVDSASPNSPPVDQDDSRLELISLNVNAGHSTNHTGKYCGYTRAILVALEYALQCDADYFVYVEQDALIYGNGIIEYCIKNMSMPAMFGHPNGTMQRLQQSLFIIDLAFARAFMSRLHAINATDNDIPPEAKFHLACSRGHLYVGLALVKLSMRNEFWWRRSWGALDRMKRYDWLPFGSGRDRPVDFVSNFFYFQHGSEEEIGHFLSLLES